MIATSTWIWLDVGLFDGELGAARTGLGNAGAGAGAGARTEPWTTSGVEAAAVTPTRTGVVAAAPAFALGSLGGVEPRAPALKTV